MIRVLLLSAVFCAPVGAAEFDAPTTIDNGSRVLSASLRDALRRLDWEFASVESGRQLIALTESVPVVELRRRRGRPIRWVRGKIPSIQVDRDRAKRLSLLDFEMLFFRARWLALAKLPINLLDAEYAVRQAFFAYMLDKSKTRPKFEKALRKATVKARRNLVERRKSLEYAREHGERGAVLFPGIRPKKTLEQLAFDLYLFSEDPYLLYESLAQDSATPSDAVSLDAIEDFLLLHSARLGEIEFHAGGRVATVAERTYSGDLARAAIFVEDETTLAELRERVGPYRSVSGKALSVRINEWLRETR